MTQEQKQLLLKDLCARIPNHVKVELHGEICTCLGYFDDFVMLTSNTPMGQQTNVANVKPYLRPLLSMTEEEKKEYHKQVDIDLDRTSEVLREQFEAGTFHPENKFTPQYCHVDWLNANHFDYRGLIPMGLALEAPVDMYKTKSL